MKEVQFKFDGDQFNRLFPFYILIGKDFNVEAVGKSLLKICSIRTGQSFLSYFEVKRPEVVLGQFEDFKSLLGQHAVLQSKKVSDMCLRGQFEMLGDEEFVLFVGTPWFGSMDKVREYNLTITDFAIHDPMIDLLHVLKTQEITTDDLKQLLNTVNRQRKELKAANEEIKNIALFPTQNPDPIIRINFSGDILRMNPAGEKLLEIEYKNKKYTNLQFFKEICKEVDLTQPRWILDLKSNDREYSFSCIGMQEHGYINMYGRDVSQQNKDKQELERLSLIIHQTNNAVIITTAEGKVEWVNDAFTRITGYALKDVQGKSPGSVLQGPLTDKSSAEFMRNQIRQKLPFVCEVYNYKKTGEGYWLRINAQPIYNNDLEVTHYFAIEEDITKEKETQAQIKAAANRLSTIITSFHAGILLETDIRTIALVNQQFCQMFGIPAQPEQLIGTDCSKAAEQTKNYFKNPVEFVNRIEQILKDKKGVTGDELELVDGRFFERDFVPIWTDEKYEGHLWIYRDISDNKRTRIQIQQQEEKYRNIISNMNLGLMEVDLNDKIQFINKSFCEMSGYISEELIGKSAANLFLGDNSAKLVKEKIKSRITGQSDVYTVLAENKDGEKRWWVISAAPRYNDKGEVVGSVGVHLDITDQRQLEEELKTAKTKAEESAMAKENFLATMSHEIRTPLNAIVGLANLMQINPQMRNQESLDILSFSSRNLLALITDILDLSKIDAGKIELAENAMNLKTLLHGINQSFRPACEEKNVELIFQVAPEVPEVIIGDELRLSQILNNLISNAVKFTQKGYVKVTVTAEILKDNKRRLFFKVTDTGIGIKKEKLKTVFSAFEQADQTIVRKYGGTGLGLNISKKLAELFGSSITLESKLHKGSTFSFYIDAKPAAEGYAETLRSNNNSNNHKPVLAGKKLLIVEDNVVNQKIAQSYLNHWGLVSDIANDGAEGLKLMKKNKYDLALIDLFMPVMDGFEAISIIKKSPELKRVPIIALTASAENSLMKRAVATGAEMCLTKPFDPQQLHDAIMSLLRFKEVAEHKPVSKTASKKADSEYETINLDNLRKASMGSEKFIADMLEILELEIYKSLTLAEEFLEKDDFDNFSKTMHKAKSSILLLGVNELRKDLAYLEKQTPEQNRTEKISVSFNHVKAVWGKAKIELQTAKNKIISGIASKKA